MILYCRHNPFCFVELRASILSILIYFYGNNAKVFIKKKMQICQTIINILIDIYVGNSNRSISLTHLSTITCGLRVCELGYVGVKQDKTMEQNGTLPQGVLFP